MTKLKRNKVDADDGRIDIRQTPLPCIAAVGVKNRDSVLYVAEAPRCLAETRYMRVLQVRTGIT